MKRRAFLLAALPMLVACSSGSSGFTGGDGGPVDSSVRDVIGADSPPYDGTMRGDGGEDATGEPDGGEPDGGDASTLEAGPTGTVLASDVPNPSFLVTDGAFLYWTDFVVTDAGTVGRVMKMPVTGGTETTLASEPGRYPAGLAVDAVSAYWGDDQGTLFAAPLAGGASVTLATGVAATSIAADGAYVYVATADGASVARVPIDGGASVALATFDAGSTPASLAIDPSNVYWPAPVVGSILAVPKSGGETVAIASTLVSPTSYQNVVSTGGAVYWAFAPTSNLQGAVLSAPSTPPEGGMPTVFYEAGASSPYSLASDGIDVFFLTGGNAPMLVLAPLDGGLPSVLAVNQFSATITGDPGPTLTVDSTHVYWLSPPNILSVPK